MARDKNINLSNEDNLQQLVVYQSRQEVNRPLDIPVPNLNRSFDIPEGIKNQSYTVSNFPIPRFRSLSWNRFSDNVVMCMYIPQLKDHESELGEIFSYAAAIPLLLVAYTVLCNPHPIFSVITFFYNMGKSSEIIEKDSEYNELLALRDGMLPTTLDIKAGQHLMNLLCSICTVPMGMIFSSFVNTKVQSWIYSTSKDEVLAQSLLREVKTNTQAIMSRVQANPDFYRLSAKDRAILAEGLIPHLATFNPYDKDLDNQDQKILELAASAALLLKKRNIIFADDRHASSILSAVCNSNDRQVSEISNKIRADADFNIPGLNMEKATKLSEVFQNRAEKARSR